MDSRKPFDPSRLSSFGEQAAGALPDDLEDLARAIIGAGIQVHKTLGPGYPERIYENAMSVELDERGLEHETQSAVWVEYKGCLVGKGAIDVLVEKRLVVELETVDMLSKVHTAQVVGYL